MSMQNHELLQTKSANSHLADNRQPKTKEIVYMFKPLRVYKKHLNKIFKNFVFEFDSFYYV